MIMINEYGLPEKKNEPLHIDEHGKLQAMAAGKRTMPERRE